MYGDYEDKEFFKELAAKAGVENLPWVRKAINSTLFLQRPKNRQRLLKFLSIKSQKNVKQDHPFLAAPSETDFADGDYELCRIVTGRGPQYPARIKRVSACEHGIVVGPSGAGKTTWLVNLGTQIHSRGTKGAAGERQVAVWFFDTEGQLPYFLAAAAASGCQDVLLIDVPRMFKFNRYFPPGVPDRLRYVTKVTAQDRECRFFRDFTMHMVRDACFELLNRQGVFSERQLLEHISSKKFKPGSRSAMSRESIVNRFRDSLQYMGSVYDTLRSHDLAGLTKRTVVWLLADMASDHKSTFVGDLTLWLKECLPTSHSPKLKLVLLIDEFADFCNIERLKRADLQEPYMLDAARVLRKRGVALILGTQSVYTVPHVILSNISCFWLVFRPSDGFSRNILAQNVSLDPEQTRYMMEMSDRYVVCRTKNCPKPFLGHVGEIALPIATDEEINERMEQTQHVLDALLEPEPGQPSLFSIKPTDEQAETLYGYYDLTKECLDYLEFLAHQSHLFLSLKDLDRIDGLSDYKANAIRLQLQDTGPGLIRFHRITTGKKGRPLSVVEITEAGYHLLSKLGLKCVPPVGHGSFEHKFWQYTVYRWALGQKYPAGIEHWHNEKSVDVTVDWDERKVAVEVALENMEKELGNLIRDLETGHDQVIFCTLTDKEQNQLRNEIARRFGANLLESGKVSFMKLSTFLQTKNNQDNRNTEAKESQDTNRPPAD